jgi:transposase
MSKAAVSSQVFCGIDVSAATLAVAVQREDRDGFEQREFANSAAGHRQLIGWLRKGGAGGRVSLEATGIYSLDVALALDRAEGIEVAVLNPKIVNRFAQTLRRSKTDRADAVALAEYSLRMPFVPWRRPSPVALELRAIGRHIAALNHDHTRLSNRLHAAEGSATTPRCVRQDLKGSIDGLKKRIVRLRKQAVALVQRNAELKRKFEQLIAIPGIAETSAVQLLSELAGLDPEMTVRQWVAYSGLDPEHRLSGTSVHAPSRISRQGNRHLRLALYMPALVGVRCDPHLKAFYRQLQARQKTRLQALMAVARKLLHAIFGIFKTGTPYDGAKLFPQLTPTS